ncbi:unnamed protein product [Fraxinus pennsylvanica]|uniref:Uncharacterized protein n=1 Tax=Fraxinus pennsylvanica TaxID=56036 RepID=A0AAD2E2W8_9LAMI|nr:unnamed protein product [Fraxinus pennsylvanica]
MGIDPITHKPKNHTLGSCLSHMAQWENARLEAEARLRCRSSPYHSQLLYTTSPLPLAAPPQHAPRPPYLDILKVWQGKCYFNSIERLESPTTLLNFPAENIFTAPRGFSVGFSGAYETGTETEDAQNNWTCIGNPNGISCPIDSSYTASFMEGFTDLQPNLTRFSSC